MQQSLAYKRFYTERKNGVLKFSKAIKYKYIA